KPTNNVIFDHARASGGEFHNGGSLFFNPKDGGKAFLYHSAGNNLNRGQSSTPDGFAGRLFRHDIEAKKSTTVAYGLRNPYRMSIDRLTGDFWIGDVSDPPGGSILFLKAGTPDGFNFGYSPSAAVGNGISGHD